MSSNTRKQALEKLKNLDREFIEEDLREVHKIKKRKKILIGITITVFTLSLATLFTLYHLGYIVIVPEETPSSITLYSAEASPKGELMIILSLEFPGEKKDQYIFSDVMAYMTNKKTNEEAVSAVKPLNLHKAGITQGMIFKPPLLQSPGACDMDIYLKGKNTQSNIVNITYLKERNF